MERFCQTNKLCLRQGVGLCEVLKFYTNRYINCTAKRAIRSCESAGGTPKQFVLSSDSYGMRNRHWDRYYTGDTYVYRSERRYEKQIDTELAKQEFEMLFL